MFNRRHFTSLLGSLAATGSMAGSGPAPDHAVKRLHPGEDEASLLGVELNRLSSPAAKRLRIGFGSCAKQSKPQPIWTHIRQQKPELFLFMGDNFYADARTEEALKARYEEFRAVSALQRFRATGKKIIAYGDNYSQRAYYLAAQADEIYLHPMGAVMIQGYGRLRNYYRDALERLGVSANVVRVGKYKNAAEPYFASGPSKETEESDAALYNALWSLYTQGVEKARHLPAGAVAAAIEGLPASLQAVGGDAAQWSVQTKFVDGLKTRDEMRKWLIERGAEDAQHKSFRQVRFEDYVAQLKPARGGDAVAVIVAEGEIGDGVAPSGRIGGKSTADLVRRAREDEGVKALVLRVNSPGGSALGSELIRRELEITRAAGKPVVVLSNNDGCIIARNAEAHGARADDENRDFHALILQNHARRSATRQVRRGCRRYPPTPVGRVVPRAPVQPQHQPSRECSATRASHHRA